MTPTPRRLRGLRLRGAKAVVLTAAALCALGLADSARAGGSSPVLAPLDASSDAAAGEQQVPPSPDQTAIDAATQQAAGAVANASQANVQNVVVIIRINSPGNDVVNQTNTSMANAAATNTALTNQATGGSAAGDASRPTAAPLAAHKRATRGTERARPRILAAAQRPSGRPKASQRAPVTHSAETTAGAPTVADPARRLAPSPAAASVLPRENRAPRAGKPRTAHVPSPPARESAVAANAAAAGVAEIGRDFSRSPALPTAAADASSAPSAAIVATLLAVLLALALGLGFTYVPAVRAWAAR